MGAGLLYVTPTELQDPKAHVLLRALFQSARNRAPCVLCLDDAHVAFPAQRHPDPEHPSHRLRTELLVQLEQLGEEQAALAKAALAGSSSNARSGSTAATKVRQLACQAHLPVTHSHACTAATTRPAQCMCCQCWHAFDHATCSACCQHAAACCLLCSCAQGGARSTAGGAAGPLAHPVVVLVVSHTPDQVDPALAAALQPLTLGPPAAATREDLLAGWALARDAALSVEHIEQLVR
jgi:SpoVK/Ycf46/Vps4 family AAA+-type ATPase